MVVKRNVADYDEVKNQQQHKKNRTPRNKQKAVRREEFVAVINK